ncbi:hypothetical protein JD844_031609 [Phrynosoma platyrhinos]|uniref:Nicotinamide N-methyltransferase n=1 Tax=Phrynosoma platyrhinos TaxID=52577 RepID=A0ABQ7T138_PHRPL|nr:hypothetical protein JD844_031609 [Phrynosoma platyrhinos]
MEGGFIGNEAYQQHFKTKDYLKTYMSFGSGDCDVLFSNVMDKLHKTFITDGIKGKTLIDIGSGPSIYQLLSACESFQEIIATDFLEQNREEMQKWLKKDPDAFDWTPMVKYVCQLEGNREKWMEKEEKLRKTIKQVLKCDVTLANPLDPLVIQPVSCVLSTFCLESASKDLPAHRSVMKNVGSLVKPGGHLILVLAVRTNYYMVGQDKFSCVYLEPEMVENAVKDAGFEIVCSEVLQATIPLAIANAQETIFLVAQKPNKTHGPSIYQLLSTCESFREIIATDFVDQNQEEMQKWLKKDPEAFDWTPMVKYVCQLEGDREKWMEKEEKLRKTIKQVLKCDVTLANPLDPLVVQPVTCVLSTFCLEAACKDLPTYRSALKNVGSLVKPGGHLIFVVALEETYYLVGQRKFSCLYLDPGMVEDAVKEAGFEILCFEMLDMKFPLALTDGQRVGFLVAQKCNEA